MRLFSITSVLLLLSGCAVRGVVVNTPGPQLNKESSYSIRAYQQKWEADENALMLAFSGGGTRAAALSYGVLKELRDTPVPTDGGSKRLLDEVHIITSVSGGSFTAAYYGLHGDGIFDDFEEVFLRQDVEGALFRRLLNPLPVVQQHRAHGDGGAVLRQDRVQGGHLRGHAAAGRTHDRDQRVRSRLRCTLFLRPGVFQSALFGPVLLPGGTGGDRVLRGAGAVQSGGGAQLSRLRLGSAGVAAGSARPGADDQEMALVVEGWRPIYDRENRQYAHFVDGGITDNLGLRAVYEVISSRVA